MPPVASAPESEVPVETTEEEKPKKARVPRPVGVKAKGDPPRKRGPPRPHRKLQQEILEGRISKLSRRIDRAQGQLEDAKRHIDAYEKEVKYREQDKKN